MSKSSRDPEEQGNPWTPGILARFPWTSLLALLTASAATAGCSAVIHSSDGVEKKQWPSEDTPIQPSVLLAVLSTIANGCIAYALHEGVVIAWWVKMLKGGTLRDCHTYWAYGSSPWKAAIAGRHSNKVALACLMAFVVNIDIPLLQRASRSGAGLMGHPCSISVGLSQELFASDFSGLYTGDGNTVHTLTPILEQAIRDFSSESIMTLDPTGCETTCGGEFLAPGWDERCNSSTTVLDFNTTNARAVWDIAHSHVLFDRNKPYHIQVKTRHLSNATDAEQGTVIDTTCDLQIATIRYHLGIYAETIGLYKNQINLLVSGYSFEKVPNHTVSLHYPSGPEAPPTRDGIIAETWLGGFALAAESLHGLDVTLTANPNSTSPADRFLRNSTFTTGRTYLNTTSPAAVQTSLNTTSLTTILNNHNTPLTTDPTPAILTTLRSITFRAGLLRPRYDPSFPTPAEQTSYNSTGSCTYEFEDYESHYQYLKYAIVVMSLAIVAQLPLFWGFWRLGRRVSMSPVEVARAFDAPVLREGDSNGVVGGRLGSGSGSRRGGVRLRYGVVGGEGGRGRLLVGVDDGKRDGGGRGGARSGSGSESVSDEVDVKVRRVGLPEKGGLY